MKVKPSEGVFFSYVITHVVETDNPYPDYAKMYNAAVRAGYPPPDRFMCEVRPLNQNETPCLYDVPLNIDEFGQGENRFDFFMNYITDEEGVLKEDERQYRKVDNYINNFDQRWEQLNQGNFKKLHNDFWFKDLIDREFINLSENFTEFQMNDLLDYHYEQCSNEQKDKFIKHLKIIADNFNYIKKNAVLGWITRTLETPIAINSQGESMPQILKDNPIWIKYVSKLIDAGVISIGEEYRWRGIPSDEIKEMKVRSGRKIVRSGPKIDLAAMLFAIENELKVSIQPTARKLCEFFFKDLEYTAGENNNKFDRSFSPSKMLGNEFRIKYFEKLFK